ncbi:MAG: sensor histidine kinase, partial [Chitinophagales bacterium]
MTSLGININWESIGLFARDISASESFDAACNIIGKFFIDTIGLQYCCVFIAENDTSVFIRRSLITKTKTIQTSIDFPVYLKITNAFSSTITDKFKVIHTHPSALFEIDPFLHGSFIIVPVYIEGRLESFIIAGDEEPIDIASGDRELMRGMCDISSGSIAKQILIRCRESLNRPGADLSIDHSKQLKQINDKLIRSNDELKQFAYVASHDLQEPLRTISNYIGLFFRKFGDTLNEEGKEYLSYAKDGAERMHNMIKDLLTYSRLDYLNEPMTEFNGNSILQEAMQNIKVSVEEGDALVFYNDFPSKMKGHQKEIVRLFQNLVENAVKFRGEQAPVIFI